MQSEEINELAAALIAAQAEFQAIPKGGTNPFFNSRYVKLSDAMDSAGPILAKNGLAVSQFVSEDDTLTTYLLHSSGQFIAHRAHLHLVKDDPQSVGSAVTYQRRYSYMSCLGLVADEDDDGNKGSERPATFKRPEVTTTNTEPLTQEDPRIDAILKAAETGENEFLTDLATKFIQYGKLSEKQLDSGFRTAQKILTTPRQAPSRTALREDEYPFDS